MAKRPYSSPPSLYSSPGMAKSRVSTSDNRMDYLLGKFLGISDTSVRSIDVSFDRLLNSMTTDSDQVYLVDRAMKLGSSLLNAGVSSLRRRASKHNSTVWPLPSDLTIRVFSFLDAQSLFNAAATCSMFKNCSMDPLCYSNIDLTTVVAKVDNGVVSTLIHRAGRVLKSLKLGIIPARTAEHCTSQSISQDIKFCTDGSGLSWIDKRTRKGKCSSILTRNCLVPLSEGCGTAGALLRRLHLYNIERLDNAALIVTLAACQSLLDLEIVGLRVELQQILLSLSKNCHMLERLFFESSETGRDDSLRSPTCVDFVANCPHVSFLALRGFKFQDFKARLLVKGLQKLKHLDFSTSYSITGSFLRNHGNYIGGNLLEVLILRDCMHLKEVEVSRFLNAVLTGDFKLLTYLDISNSEGLASERCWYNRCYRSSNIPIQQVMDERPRLRLLADFPLERSYSEMEIMTDGGGVNSDISSGINSMSSNTSDTFSSSSSGSSYGGGDSDGGGVHHLRFPFFDDSSEEEVEFMVA